MKSEQALELVEGGAELFDRVEPLWLQLRTHHANLSPRWRENLLGVTFEQRREGLIEKGGGGVLIVLAHIEGCDVGYCVSTIVARGKGEVDSLYVCEHQRGRGIGEALMARTMAWFQRNAIGTIGVEVLEGNAPAQKFYERLGFAPRTLRLVIERADQARHSPA